MSPGGKGTGEVVEALREAIHNLLIIKGRLPLLQAVAQELERLDGGQDLLVRNDAVLRVVRDSYDMLVVDLASLREGIAAKRGMLNKLRHHLDRLRPFTPDDVDLGPIHYVDGKSLSAKDEAAFVAEQKAWMARTWNERLERLFPTGAPVTEAQVEDLIRRFRKDTEPTERDRNRVRAHRYEEASKEGAKYFQTLGQVEQQVQVFEQYFNDLFLVLAKGTYSMTPLVNANAEGTARDLADLILLGSIDDAVVRYGVVRETVQGKRGWRWVNVILGFFGYVKPSGPPPWYWYHRKQFYDQGASLADEGSEDERGATPRGAE